MIAGHTPVSHTSAHRGQRLGAALVLSLLAHLALLGLFIHRDAPHPLPQSLQVSVQAPAVAGSDAGKSAQPEPTDAQTPDQPASGAVANSVPDARQAIPEADSRRRPSGAEHSEPDATPADPAPEGNAAVDRAAVESEILEALNARFSYPALARRRGWEGEVVLSLDLDNRGRVARIEIEQSSGHRILDRAALDALKALAGQHPLVEGIHQPVAGLRIPIVYRLQG